MDILIKGMEIPKETQCCYTIFPNGKVIVHWDGKVLGEAEAIELPPHGRLGDLDKLSGETNYLICTDCEIESCEDCDVEWCKNIIENAPTVLEAST